MSKDSNHNDKPGKQGASTPGGKQQANQTEKELQAGNLGRSDPRSVQSAADTSAAVTGRDKSAGARGDSNQGGADKAREHTRDANERQSGQYTGRDEK